MRLTSAVRRSFSRCIGIIHDSALSSCHSRLATRLRSSMMWSIVVVSACLFTMNLWLLSANFPIVVTYNRALSSIAIIRFLNKPRLVYGIRFRPARRASVASVRQSARISSTHCNVWHYFLFPEINNITERIPMPPSDSIKIDNKNSKYIIWLPWPPLLWP